MEWFVVIGGGPLDNSKLHQFSGFKEEIVQIPDPMPGAPGDYCAIDTAETTYSHKNHLYIRQHRADWTPASGSRATWCYRYAGILQPAPTVSPKP